MTLVVFDKRKMPRQLICDIVVVGVVQFGGLLYGLRTVYLARPVALVFEISRFRVVPADEVVVQELPQAPRPYQHLSLTGPMVLGVRHPGQGNETFEAIVRALSGSDLGQRPSYWISYGDARAEVLQRSRPLSVLLAHEPGAAPATLPLLRKHHLAVESARFMPVIARARAVALLDGQGEIVGFAPINGFF
jgi:hypothetical protein